MNCFVTPFLPPRVRFQTSFQSTRTQTINRIQKVSKRYSRISITPTSCEATNSKKDGFDKFIDGMTSSVKQDDDASNEEIDKLFKKLSHVNKTIRKKASYELSEIASQKEIERLLLLLEEEDTTYRRTAVQTLGMIGMPTVSSLVKILSSSENSTVRASCAKALAAVVLYYPKCRQNFPLHVIEKLELTLSQDPDPVTKLSVIGCLGTLGSDSKDKSEPDSIIKGSHHAVSVLEKTCLNFAENADSGTYMVVISALAQIAQNGSPESKQHILSVLEKVADLADANTEDEESSSKYIKEAAMGHIDQLENALAAPAPPAGV